MRTFNLLSLAFVTAIAASAAAAEPVVYCKNAKERLVVSDRPCGAATAGQPPAEAQVPGYVADRIQADDIFSARTKMREGDKPMPEGPAAPADSRSVVNY